MRKYYNLNEIDGITNFQDTAKAGLLGTFVTLKAYIRKEECSQIINKLSLKKNKNKLYLNNQKIRTNKNKQKSLYQKMGKRENK